jgi:cytochrome P450
MCFLQWQQILLIVAAFISARTLLSILRRRRAASRYGCSPALWYPHQDPVLGYDLYCKIKAAKEGNTLDSFITEILSLYGNKKTLMSLTWGLPTLISADHRLAQAILTTNMDDFGVAPIRKIANQPFFGQDVFVSDGLPWKKNRKFVQPLLRRSRFADLRGLEKHVNRLMQLLPADTKTQVDLQSWFMLMVCTQTLVIYLGIQTTESSWLQYVDFATEFISGESLGSLAPKVSPAVEEFLAALERVNKGVQRRIMLAPILMFAGRDREFEGACKQVHQYFDKCIDKELSKDTNALTEEPPTLARDALSVSQDRTFVRDQLIGFFLPMYSSSVFTLSDLFFHLARAPRVWQTLRKEVVAQRGKPLMFELLKSMTYLQAVIRESKSFYD